MLSLGIYRGVSLKDARDWREAAHKVIASGRDPSYERRTEHKERLAFQRESLATATYRMRHLALTIAYLRISRRQTTARAARQSWSAQLLRSYCSRYTAPCSTVDWTHFFQSSIPTFAYRWRWRNYPQCDSLPPSSIRSAQVLNGYLRQDFERRPPQIRPTEVPRPLAP